MWATAEALGTKKEHLTSVVSFVVNVRSHGDITTLTTAAATTLRGAITLKARALKEMWNINVVTPLEKIIRFGICGGKAKHNSSSSTRCIMQGDLGIGSVREVNVKSGLPATTSTERLKQLDDEEHILGYLIRHHETNGGLAIATMFAVMIGGIGLGQSAPSMVAFTKARVAAAKISRIVDHKPGVDRNSESGLELETIIGLGKLKNVDSSYPSRPEVKILNDFSLNVPAGKTIALVDISGSSKSIVVSLIKRSYDPRSCISSNATISE
ncbi:hypothetical protein KIW84_012819 [Lathyrus oleraceus]|uniref:VAN3-binding protein-like auxin canalisation domain-containing protein n=1 Tax=Pisum sativum TaxID=3888 RepID=A0A9D5GWV2_PEA|nr:hypothetical protein KIW84_012819 [Pisum sativum]